MLKEPSIVPRSMNSCLVSQFIPVPVEMPVHHLERKRVVACSHRSMRRERLWWTGSASAASSNFWPLKTSSRTRSSIMKARVTFIGMKNAGLKAQSAKNADAADAQHDFLPDPVILVAAIETRRQFPVAGEFSSTSVSIRYSGTAPRFTRQTSTKTCSVPTSSSTTKRSRPSGAADSMGASPAFQLLVDVFLPAIRAEGAGESNPAGKRSRFRSSGIPRSADSLQ